MVDEETNPSENAPEPAAPAAEQQSAPEQPAPEQPAPEQPAPEQPAPEQPAPEQPAAGQPAPGQEAAGQDAKPRRKRQRAKRPPRPRERQPRRQAGPLPIAELRAAAQAIIDQHGSRKAVRDAFSVLADRERREISQLVRDDGEWRIRARNISAGSLGAGRVGKALAAQQVSMASPEDLWPVTLSKEEAAERAAHIRNARRRDERRAQREADRENRADRVSRADLAKAQDGRVGAQIRFVTEKPKDERRKKDKPEPQDEQSTNVLDRLGY